MAGRREDDAILLGFGHGFLGISEQIVSGAKQLRKDLNIDFPPVHIVDHDYDPERNTIHLNDHEFVIRVHGVEQVRHQCDPVEPGLMIAALKKVILEHFAHSEQG